MLTLARRLEAVVVTAGRVVAWLTLAMVLVTVLVVVLRYFFSAGRIWLQELVTWMHALVFLLGAAYTLARDEHVRVDVVYRRLSPRARAAVDLAGTLLLLLPVCGFLLWVSWDYVADAWRLREGSREAGGLPYPFSPLLKSALPAMLVLLLLQGVAMALRALHTLLGGGAVQRRGASAGL